METKLDALEDARRRSWVGAWVAELRPEQWVKNLVVYAGCVFGLRLLDPVALALSTAVFAAFCAASSAAYLLNDVMDRERDRRHPDKRFRPVAAGRIGPASACVVSAALAAGALAGSLALGPASGAILASYLVLNLGYSLGLKHVPIVDVISISTGFVLRAVAGAVAIQVAISPWLVVCTFMGMLFVALAKRRAELAAVTGATETRPSARGYSVELLDQMITILVAVTLVSYCVYTLSPDVREKFGVDHLYVTVPFVVYGVFRYLSLTRAERAAENPTRVLLTDRPLAAAIFLWMLAVVLLLYLGTGPRA